MSDAEDKVPEGAAVAFWSPIGLGATPPMR